MLVDRRKWLAGSLRPSSPPGGLLRAGRGRSSWELASASASCRPSSPTN